MKSMFKCENEHVHQEPNVKEKTFSSSANWTQWTAAHLGEKSKHKACPQVNLKLVSTTQSEHLENQGVHAQTSHKAVCFPGLPINPTKYSTAHATVSLRFVPLFYKISSLPGLFMGPSPPQDAPVPAGALEGLTHQTPFLPAAFCQPPSHSACAEVSYWAREQLASLRTQYFKVFCLLFIALWTGWAVQGEWLTTPLPVPPFAVIQHL